MNKEADAIPAAERRTTYESIWAAVGHEDGTASGEREEEEDVGGVMEPRTGDAVDAILTLTTMGTTESGDSPRPGTYLRSPFGSYDSTDELCVFRGWRWQ